MWRQHARPRCPLQVFVVLVVVVVLEAAGEPVAVRRQLGDGVEGLEAEGAEGGVVGGVEGDALGQDVAGATLGTQMTAGTAGATILVRMRTMMRKSTTRATPRPPPDSFCQLCLLSLPFWLPSHSNKARCPRMSWTSPQLANSLPPPPPPPLFPPPLPPPPPPPPARLRSGSCSTALPSVRRPS